MMADLQDGDIRDIQVDMKHLTTKIIAKILFDADVTKDADEIGAALIVAREELTERMRSGLLISRKYSHTRKFTFQTRREPIG